MSTSPPPVTSWADEVASPIDNGSSLIDVRPDDVAVKLSDLQGDVNSPLYSAQSFADLNLNEELMKGLLSMGFQKPSAIQSKALPMLLPPSTPANLIAQSQSGTGKTATFVITVLSRINLEQPDMPQALILAPSRELARQIEGVVKSIGQFLTGLKVQAIVPGAVERGRPVQANVLVGTPGSTTDLIKRRQIDVSQLRVLVLDEADNMLDAQGLGDQCMRVKQILPNLNQILLFSATFPERVMTYAQQFAPNAHEIKLQKEQLTVAGIKQMYMDCPSDEGKYDILAQLYGLMTVGSSIIFVKKRDTANRIADRLTKDGHRVLAVHSAFEGSERDSIVKDFREGKAKVLITTNVLARGIDVSSVSMVINYDIPMTGRADDTPDPETYLHRIGRTGRFGRVGVSISFVFDRKSYTALKDIALHYGIDLVRLDTDDWEATEQVVAEIIKSSRAGTNLKA